jgi:uncharacterized protein (TIGR03000 family)
MVFKCLTAIAAITMATVTPSALAADCRPSGCGDASCAPCAGAPSSCQSCNTGCQVCGGQGFCCDGLIGEGIDVDSLTPEAQSKQLLESLQARLIFELPEDADIYLADQKMMTAGAKRTFVVPVNDATKVYQYRFKVDVVRGGQKYFKNVTLDTLRAGAILKVTVEAPPAVEGEPATIVVAVEPVAPGGATSQGESADDAGVPDVAGE